MTPTRELLEAALQGFDIQRKAIEAKQAEIREALKSPVEVMAKMPLAEFREPWQKRITTMLDDGTSPIVEVTSHFKPERRMSAAGRAAISKATKARWAKYRKEQKRAS